MSPTPVSNESLTKIVTALIRDGLVHPDQGPRAEQSIRTALGQERPARTSGMPKLIEVIAYLGAALVVAGVFLLMAQEWENFSNTEQVIALGVVTLILGIAGIVAATVGKPNRTDDIRRRLSSTLLTAFAIGLGLTMGRWMEIRFPTDFDEISWGVFTGSALTLLAASLLYVVAPSAFGQVTILGSAMIATFALTPPMTDSSAFFVATTLLVVALLWLAMAELGWLREQMIARALGVALAIVAAQHPVMEGSHSWYGYLLTCLVVILSVGLYLTKVAWPYVAGVVIAITLVVPEVVTDWTNGSLGAVGGVLIAGVTLLVASLIGYRMSLKAKD
ncbi:MAG: DUF2157 domain-containing protein [Nocardioidaceae bacterium]|nr:DUF2157 domain-containing protein [Nocardioidaceae bacterium]